jgi:hypothetical protein
MNIEGYLQANTFCRLHPRKFAHMQDPVTVALRLSPAAWGRRRQRGDCAANQRATGGRRAMGFNAVIDVAIGLVLMYLVLSLVCTVINELLATLTKLRATTLAAALGRLIDVPVLRRDFYDHGLIDGAKAANEGNHVSYLSGRTFALALLGSLDPTKPLPGFEDTVVAIKNLPDSNIRDALLSQVMTAEGDLARLRDNVAAWYDHVMDRVAGVYKRYLKWLSLAVGSVLAVVINADSLTVGEALWKDGTLRAEMGGIVQTMVTSKLPPSEPGDTQAAKCKAEMERATAAGVSSQSPQGAPAPLPLSCVISSLGYAESQLRPVPIGWQHPPEPRDWPAKLAGLLITALALSLGAPFWFDLLSTFVNLRGAGPKPQRSDPA